MTPSQQFKPTPRFSALRSTGPLSFQSTPRAIQADSFSPQGKPALRAGNHVDDVQPSRGPRPKLTRVESIHDASQEDVEAGNNQDEADEMLFDSVTDEGTLLVESVGSESASPTYHGTPASRHEEQAQQLLDPAQGSLLPPGEPPAKRRRLAPNPDLTPRQKTTTKQADPTKTDNSVEILESPPRGGKAPRFRLPGQTPVSTTSMTSLEPPSTQSVSSRPRNPFLLPPNKYGMAGSGLDASAITPLPEHFSPHRRSQKFVPGGMADVVRSWILSVGHGGFQADTANHQPRQRIERTPRPGQPARIQVTERTEEKSGHRLKFVAGQATARTRSSATQNEESSSSIRAVLVGPAKDSSRDVKVGDDVAIAPPTWEVEVGPHEEKWLVVVDWNVTSKGTVSR